MVFVKKSNYAFISKEIDSKFGLNIEEMFKYGLHFGHRVSRCNPKMKKNIFGVRNTVHIINLEKTAESFEKALSHIQDLISSDKSLMIVGTKIQMQDLVKDLADKFDLPYVVNRWLGGTFTNFEVIKKRVDYFKDLEKKKESKELEKYTKKERIKINKELEDLKAKFEGIRNLDKLPDAIFVLDVIKDKLAVKEAKDKGIEVIGIVDTNIDPDLVDFPIFANDDAITSVKYILGKVAEAIKKAKK